MQWMEIDFQWTTSQSNHIVRPSPWHWWLPSKLMQLYPEPQGLVAHSFISVNIERVFSSLAVDMTYSLLVYYAMTLEIAVEINMKFELKNSVRSFTVFLQDLYFNAVQPRSRVRSHIKQTHRYIRSCPVCSCTNIHPRKGFHRIHFYLKTKIIRFA